MKFTKLSLVAAIAVSSAFAGGDIAPVEPAPVVEVSPWTFGGDAKLYYTTDSSSMFSQATSSGQAAISADIGYAINNNWKINAGVTGIATLGLDDSVVSGVWLVGGAEGAANSSAMTSVGDALWIDTLNVTGTMMDGALTMVLGRQMLDTPLAFSETWNIAPNTFDAAVAIAKPMENLSLIAGYIYDGNGNGTRITTFDGEGISGEGGFTHSYGYFPLFSDTPNEISNGAWTVAGVATFAGITAQAWYYDVMDVAQAVWLQGDTDFAGFTIGAQYAWIGADSTLENVIGSVDDSSAWAAKLGYKMDAFTVWAAYSSVDNDGLIPVANTATMLGGAGGNGWGPQGGGAQTKLYTEAWWNYGLVGQPGADTTTAAISYNVGDLALFNGVQAMAQYTHISGAEERIQTALSGSTNFLKTDLDEITLLVGAKVYGFDAQIAYINTDRTDTPVAGGASVEDTTDTVQLYLTYNF